jgi:hypothetical protein
MKVYIGLPCCEARYETLRSCLHELMRVGITHNIMEADRSLSSLPNPDYVHPYNEAMKETVNSKSEDRGYEGTQSTKAASTSARLFIRKENVLME